MSVLHCSICGGHLLDCDCHLGEEPPADHLGESFPRPLYADEWPEQEGGVL